MSTTVRDIYEFIDSIAPFRTQESWDNSGFLVGDVSKEVTKVAVCLDVTHDTLQKAADFGADLLVSHHPVIFHPMKGVSMTSSRSSSGWRTSKASYRTRTATAWSAKAA